MSNGSGRSGFRHGHSFIAVLAFVASFFGSRLFATLLPTIVLENQGIHFHHFWVGIAMLSVAGWLGIAWKNDARLERMYAVIYGLGAGFIGDEVGLLLTLGNYQSELTYLFFIGALSFIIIVMLLVRYWEQLQRDVLHLSYRERLLYFGIFIAGFSSLFFALGQATWGIPVAVFGTGIFFLGIERRRKPTKPQSQ